MQVVVKIFIKIFGFSNNTATRLMMQVHHEGRSIVWSGALERAESYCVALQVAGLRSSLERAS
jgi:ATP-dependent Clp protease adaptor protein ClpS